jgi:uncharacterized protein (UPF0128 family)
LLHVHKFALGKRDGEAVLFGENSGGGASIVQSMLVDNARRISVPIVDVNRFIRTSLPENARLWIKLNCEGGEADIVERLCEFERVDRIVCVMADFDIVKKAGGYFRKRSLVGAAKAAGLAMELAEDVMVGKGHVQRTENWLAGFPELIAHGHSKTRQPQRLKRKLKYWFRDMRSAVGLSKSGYR